MNSNYVIEYKVGGDDAKNNGWINASRDFSSIKRFYRTREEAEKDAKQFRRHKNVRVRVRQTSDNAIVYHQLAPGRP